MAWKEVSAIIWIWDTDKNKEMIGVLERFDYFNDGDFGECLKYTILRDDGMRYSFIGGTSFDKLIESKGISNGDLIKVVYEGKKEIAGGRKVNIFHVYIDEDTWAKNRAGNQEGADDIGFTGGSGKTHPGKKK